VKRGWVFVVAASAVLLALSLNLVLIKGGSYLATPVPGVKFPDLLFFSGALVGLVLSLRANFVQPRGIWALTAITSLYLVIQFVRALLAGVEVYDFLRDSAFFVYILMLPGVIYLVRVISDQVIIVVLRTATALLTIWLMATFLGWNSADFGAQFSEHLFSLNGDVAGIFLAIGVLSWDRQFGLRSVWLPQLLMLGTGLQLQSRVGAASIVLVLVVLLIRKPSVKSKIAFGAIILVGIILGTFLSLSAPGQQVNRATESALPGVSRLIPSEVTGQGTINSRIDTWNDVIQFAREGATLLVGGGPGSDALQLACEGSCLVGGHIVVDGELLHNIYLRYPHNIELSILLYHGLLGLVLFATWLIFLFVSSWGRRPRLIQWLPLLLLLAGAQLGVILESPFGLVPFVFFSAWILVEHSTGRQISSMPTPNPRTENW
jgi:O-antigen ligase